MTPSRHGVCVYTRRDQSRPHESAVKQKRREARSGHSIIETHALPLMAQVPLKKLMYMLMRHDEAFVRQWCDAGNDVNARLHMQRVREYSPLDWAIAMQFTRNPCGQTPIYAAAAAGNCEALCALLERGANAAAVHNLPDATVSDFCRHRGHTHVLEALRWHRRRAWISACVGDAL